MTSNKTFVFKKIPSGFPVPGQDIVVEDRPIDLNQAAPAGGLIVKVLSASLDPYLRGRMRPAEIKSYAPAFQLDGAVENDTVAKVLKSDLDEFKQGDEVVVFGPIAEYAIVSAGIIKAQRCRKIHNPHKLDSGLFVGALGMPGLTAYASLYRIAKPKKGETIFVSSAAGAVGQIVAQVAKHEGLRVIGSAGADDKVTFLEKELGIEAFNYKTEKPADALKRLTPDGIEIFFDNVGGETLDAALAALKVHGRVVACGMISQYNNKSGAQYVFQNLVQIVAKQLLIEGFLVGDAESGPKYFQEHQDKVQAWLADGTFKAKVDTTKGIEHAPDAFLNMLHGKNFGKAVVHIADA